MKRLSILLFYFMHVVSSYAFHFVPGIDDAGEEIEGDFHIPILIGDAAKESIIRFLIFIGITGICYWIANKIDEDTENTFLEITTIILGIIGTISFLVAAYYALRIWWIILIIIVIALIIGGIYYYFFVYRKR